MTSQFTLQVILAASAEEVYNAWLSSEEHTAMSGGVARINPQIGGAFEALDGYIVGRTLKLDPGRWIMQQWRNINFSSGTPFSLMEILLEQEKYNSCRLTLFHYNVPEHQSVSIQQEWQAYYFKPMQKRFKLIQFRKRMLSAASNRFIKHDMPA